jgi:hypothetical protein
MQNTSDDQPVDDDSEWRFGLDEVGEDATAAEEETMPPLEPGNPSLENAFFVLLGVVGTLLIFVSL